MNKNLPYVAIIGASPWRADRRAEGARRHVRRACSAGSRASSEPSGSLSPTLRTYPARQRAIVQVALADRDADSESLRAPTSRCSWGPDTRSH
jgi:hypothetical protein